MTTNPFPDGYCPALVCLSYGYGPEEPGIAHAVEHLTQEYASWAVRRKHGLMQEQLGFLDRLRLERKVRLLLSTKAKHQTEAKP